MRRENLLAYHLAQSTPRSPRPRDPQADATRALATAVVGVVVLVLLWGWLR